MIKNILAAGIKKALYGCAGALGFGLTQLAQNGAPPSDQIGQLLWQVAIIPALTGLAGALTRWASFDPARVGR